MKINDNGKFIEVKGNPADLVRLWKAYQTALWPEWVGYLFARKPLLNQMKSVLRNKGVIYLQIGCAKSREALDIAKSTFV